MGPLWRKRADPLLHGDAAVSFAGTRKGVSNSSAPNDSGLGCAFGEGVASLARVFPRSQVAGLDFSKTAIDEARGCNAGHEYIWSEDGSILRDFDVILTSNCLEHFEAPLAVLENHLASCNSLYIVLVPYNECPLHPQHRAQFRRESFPVYFQNFTRIHAEPIVTDPHFWPGQQLLIVYGSDRYLREGPDREDSVALVVARLAGRREYRDRAEALEARLREAEQLRDRISLGLRAFQAEFEKQLSVYRSQRAWRAMLAMRKSVYRFGAAESRSLQRPR
jgi:hypothetical protein